MTPEAENAIRSVARKCRAEIIKAIDGRPKSDHDSIITTLLDKHARTIQCLPPGTFPAKRWLSYFVREIDKEMTR
ncbi:hypothetical protein [Mixta calida]|uniref:Uncharacterized protein n=1 Tax=Mixta calida TaxID=665913 RepID=A0ABM6S2L3_9GAMM|nr:hypothetical protein [Mixta calida]AUY25538.1 hypothetical protein C2E16_11880 [Mixta calida]MDU5828516.1 hypothetical protein [Mixta calida]ORM57243.1 hypothetical protein HA40_12830 [Mixta calida]